MGKKVLKSIWREFKEFLILFKDEQKYNNLEKSDQDIKKDTNIWKRKDIDINFVDLWKRFIIRRLIFSDLVFIGFLAFFLWYAYVCLISHAKVKNLELTLGILICYGVIPIVFSREKLKNYVRVILLLIMWGSYFTSWYYFDTLIGLDWTNPWKISSGAYEFNYFYDPGFYMGIFFAFLFGFIVYKLLKEVIKIKF
jgi:uncharacterized membrane protein